jgi:hypothetical protein
MVKSVSDVFDEVYAEIFSDNSAWEDPVGEEAVRQARNQTISPETKMLMKRHKTWFTTNGVFWVRPWNEDSKLCWFMRRSFKIGLLTAGDTLFICLGWRGVRWRFG